MANGINCSFTPKLEAEISESLNISKGLANVLVSAWKTKNRTAENPTVADIRKYYKDRSIQYHTSNKTDRSKVVDYTILGGKVYNKEGVEVYADNTSVKFKIATNFDVQRGKAVVVDLQINPKTTHKYVVYRDLNKIVSVAEGKEVKWPENHGLRKRAIEAAKDKFEILDAEQKNLSENTSKKEEKPSINIEFRGVDNPYRKEDPTKEPNTAFVFTENTQAYTATHRYMAYETSDPEISGSTNENTILKVRDMADTKTPNTAGIRSLDGVSQQPNVFGIVVKKYQKLKGATSFAAQEGQFRDTNIDFEIFKTYNEDFFKKLGDFMQKHGNKVVFPTSFAKGRAALPMRFAEWLQEQLLNRYGINTIINPTTTPGYNGFGLDVLNTENKTNTSKNNASSYINYSGGAAGSDSYWKSIGESYGIQYSDETDSYTKLSEAGKKQVEEKYLDNVRTLARRETASIFPRRDTLQAAKGDEIFAIGHILDPKEVDKKGYRNDSGKQVVEGGTGYAVETAIKMGKLVHVFDQKTGKWYTWNNEAAHFVEEDTPVLTPKFAGIGTRELEESGKQAIKDVFIKTFGKNAVTKNSTTPTELPFSPEETKEVSKKITRDIDIETDTSVLNIQKESEFAKLNRDMSPQEISDRIAMITKKFSLVVDSFYTEKILEIEKELKREDLSIEDRLDLEKKLSAYKDATNGRRFVISDIGIENIFNAIKESYESYLDYSAEEYDESYGKGMGEYILNAYNTVLDNFNALAKLACTSIENEEQIRIILEEDKKGNLKGKTQKSTAEEENSEKELNDGEEGERVDGNGGWSYKVRFVDPRTSLSKYTKKVLSNIQKVDREGNLEVDDLGEPRYFNSEYVHALLINDLSKMITPSDFCTKDSEGKYSLPALENFAKKYPWAKQIINTLIQDPNLISAFYADFRKDFIPYSMFKKFVFKDGPYEDVVWKYIGLNKSEAEASTLSRIVANYQQGNTLDEDSIYSSGGKINIEKGKVGEELVDSILDLVNIDIDQDDFDLIISNISKGLNMLGIDANKDIITAILESSDGITDIYNVAMAMNNIFKNIEDMPEGSHLIDFFKDEYKTIARIVGEVSELDNTQSFRQGDKTYYSYSAPNYVDTMFKKFKSDEKRDGYLDNNYRKYDWFYHNGEWQNEWLKLIDTDEDVRDLMAMDELIVISENIPDSKKSIDISYSEWASSDIQFAFVSKYFSENYSEGSKKQFGWYNFPIFSDSPVVKFIKFIRYTGNYKEELIPKFNTLVKQELRRMRLVEERRKKGVAEITNFDKKGSRFLFMPELNNLEIDGRKFPDIVQEYIKAENTEALDAIINTAVERVIDSNFANYSESMKNNDHLEELKEYLISRGVILNESELTDALEEYYWNQMYASSQIIELTTTDLAFYKDGVDFQKRFKEVYAAGTKLNTLSKYGRSIEKTIYLSDQTITSNVFDTIKRALEDANKKGLITDMDLDSILYKFKDINVADAQAYRSLSSMRAVLDMLGAWTDDMQRAMNNFKEGEWNMADFNIVWQTVKPFVYTQVDTPDGLGGSIKVPHQNKNSEFLLLAMYQMAASAVGESAKMRAINKFMEDNDIDVIQFESAVKAGKQGVININYSPKKLKTLIDKMMEDPSSILRKENISREDIDKDGIKSLKSILDSLLESGKITQKFYNSIFEKIEPTEEEVYDILQENSYYSQEEADKINEGVKNRNNWVKAGDTKKEVVHELPYDDYVIQQPTPEHLFDVTAVFGSQFRNLIVSDMPDDPDFRVTVNGKEYTKKEVIDLYHSIIVENLLEDFEKVKGKFTNIETLQNELLEQVKGNAKYGRDMLDALEIVEIVNPVTGEKEKVFNIPLNNPSTTTKIQELVDSMFKNAVTKQTIKGGACILVSNFGFTDKLNIVFKDSKNKEITFNTYLESHPNATKEEYKEWIQEEQSKGNISISCFECYLPAYSKKFYAQFMETKVGINSRGEEYTYEELDVNKLPEDLKKIIGYRIPTEDKYSMAPLRIKGFLPQQNGSSIMVPAEITQIAGSDFDVDKMFLMIPEFRRRNKYNHRAAKNIFFATHPELAKKVKEAKNEAFLKAINKAIEEHADDEDYTVENLKTKENFKEFLKQAYTYGEIDWVDGYLETYNRWFKHHKYDDEILISSTFEKIKYDTSKAASSKENSRAARNNMLIDISYGILTNPNTAIKILDPGNFDRAKLSARKSVIVRDKELLLKYIGLDPKKVESGEEKVTVEEVRKAVERIKNASLEEIDDFVKDNRVERNPLTIDTFIYNHKQNMTGGALIGMYANNTTMQAKFQEINLAIKDENTFMINGVRIKNLSAITSPFGERISKNCANFSAASVDNVKDPVLADLMQNTKTANIAGFMLRAGLSIQDIGLLFSQPGIRDLISVPGGLELLIGQEDPKKIKERAREILKKHNFTTEELINNIVADTLDIEEITNSEADENILYLMYMIKEESLELGELTRISRADSPNGAIATSIAKAKNQLQRVNVFTRNSKKKGAMLSGMEDIAKNDLITPNMSKDQMREALLKRKLPMLQAFYSLGIELALDIMSPYFAQLTPFMNKELKTLYNNSKDGTLSDTNIENFYNDAVKFGLSKTTLFGDDDKYTYEEKRNYYLYKYPSKFIRIKAENPEIANLGIMKKMKVENGVIILEKSARLTSNMRDSLMKDLDTLLYMDNPEAQKLAVDLLRYSYYKEGLSFGPNSFGNFFSTSFLNNFPEFVTALREMIYNMKDGTYFENFLPQFYANHYAEGILPKYLSSDGEILSGGYIAFKKKNVYNSNIKGYNPYEYLVIDNQLYVYNREKSGLDTIIYSKGVSIENDSSPKYNANMTVQEMSEIITDAAIIEEAKSVNSEDAKVDLPSEPEEEYEQLTQDDIEAMGDYVDFDDEPIIESEDDDFIDFEDHIERGKSELENMGEKPLCVNKK